MASIRINPNLSKSQGLKTRIPKETLKPPERPDINKAQTEAPGPYQPNLQAQGSIRYHRDQNRGMSTAQANATRDVSQENLGHMASARDLYRGIATGERPGAAQGILDQARRGALASQASGRGGAGLAQMGATRAMGDASMAAIPQIMQERQAALQGYAGVSKDIGELGLGRAKMTNEMREMQAGRDDRMKSDMERMATALIAKGMDQETAWMQAESQSRINEQNLMTQMYGYDTQAATQRAVAERQEEGMFDDGIDLGWGKPGNVYDDYKGKLGDMPGPGLGLTDPDRDYYAELQEFMKNPGQKMYDGFQDFFYNKAPYGEGQSQEQGAEKAPYGEAGNLSKGEALDGLKMASSSGLMGGLLPMAVGMYPPQESESQRVLPEGPKDSPGGELGYTVPDIYSQYSGSSAEALREEIGRIKAEILEYKLEAKESALKALENLSDSTPRPAGAPSTLPENYPFSPSPSQVHHSISPKDFAEKGPEREFKNVEKASFGMGAPPSSFPGAVGAAAQGMPESPAPGQGINPDLLSTSEMMESEQRRLRRIQDELGQGQTGSALNYLGQGLGQLPNVMGAMGGGRSGDAAAQALGGAIGMGIGSSIPVVGPVAGPLFSMAGSYIGGEL